MGSLFQFSLNSVCWFTFQKRSGKVARPKERIGGRYILWGWDHKQLSARLLAATVPPEGQLEDTGGWAYYSGDGPTIVGSYPADGGKSCWTMAQDATKVRFLNQFVIRSILITPPQRAGAMAVPQICCRRQHASNHK